MSTIPTQAFVSKLKSNLAATQREVTDLQEDNASLQQQNSDLTDENSALKRQLRVLSPTDGSTATPVDFDRIIALENELRRVNADFREFVVDADDKVNKEKLISMKLAEDLKEHKQYCESLKRQLTDNNATQKALRAQKAQAEKKARDADARAAKYEMDYDKAAKEKRTWEAKFKREVMSKEIDGGKAAQTSINNPNPLTKSATNVVNTFGKSPGRSKSVPSAMAGKHPAGPVSKHPLQSIARLSIGSSTEQPFVVEDDEEEDMPLMQRKMMNGRMPGSKRKAAVLQEDDDEDMDDEETIPIKRERRE